MVADFLDIPVYFVCMTLDTSRSRIFCHRGLWSHREDQNTRNSFVRAAASGFSVETDLHAFEGRIVISHDLPMRDSGLTLREVLSMNCTFALNLKSDGLSQEIGTHLDVLLENGSFVFDGSIPEMLNYRRKLIPLALRLSEFEGELAWKCDTLWLDGFESDWWLKNPQFLLDMHGKTIVVVSPEIHRRDPINVWSFLAENWKNRDVKFAICTDMPNEFLEQL